MIGNSFELYFHWRKTFDVRIKKKEKVQRSQFSTILPHFCYRYFGLSWIFILPHFCTNFYSGNLITFSCELESLIHWLLTSWSRQWWLKIKHSLTQLVFGRGWLYCPDSLEYEQCNQKIITNIAGWNSLSRWCWHSHFPGTWSEAFLHGSIWNHAPECGWSWRPP